MIAVGQAAGLAARQGISPSELAYESLKQALLEQDVILDESQSRDWFGDAEKSI